MLKSRAILHQHLFCKMRPMIGHQSRDYGARVPLLCHTAPGVGQDPVTHTKRRRGWHIAHSHFQSQVSYTSILFFPLTGSCVWSLDVMHLMRLDIQDRLSHAALTKQHLKLIYSERQLGRRKQTATPKVIDGQDVAVRMPACWGNTKTMSLGWSTRFTSGLYNTLHESKWSHININVTWY